MLGVGVLLVIQVYFTMPFYIAICLFAPFWLGVIVVMILGFFFVDGISHKMQVHPIASLVFGIARDGERGVTNLPAKREIEKAVQ